MTETSSAARVTFREVFGIPEFRAMWFAELWSIAGDQLARVALSVMVFESTKSATLTGLTYALTFAPSLLGGIFLAGLADRFPRRDVMVLVDLVRAGLVLLVAIPGTPFWVLCLLVGMTSLFNPLFKAAQLALLPDVLAGDRYPVGMAIRNMTVQSAQLVGFAGGGLLTAAINPRGALVADSVTFVVSAVLLRIGLQARPSVRRSSTQRWIHTVGQGGRLMFADRGVRLLILLTWLMAVITVYEGLAAPYAAALGGGSAMVGLLLAGDPLGGVIGSYLFVRWVPAHRRAQLIGPLAVVAAAVLLVCFLRPGLVGSMMLFVVSGGLGTIVVMQATTSFTVAVPDAHRAQIMGLSNTGLSTASGLSPLLAGIVADQIGAAPAVAWFGLASAAVALLMAIRWNRVLRTDPTRWTSSLSG